MDIAMLIDKGLYVFLGGLITAIINYYLSKHKDKQIHRIISFCTAAEKFRHSFDDTLLNIDQAEKPVTCLLHEFFLSHKVAMWHFKYYITGKTRDLFEKTWNEYENYYNENYKKGAVFAQFASAETNYEIQKREKYRQHIENLLKFTM